MITNLAVESVIITDDKPVSSEAIAHAVKRLVERALPNGLQEGEMLVASVSVGGHGGLTMLNQEVMLAYQIVSGDDAREALHYPPQERHLRVWEKNKPAEDEAFKKMVRKVMGD